MADWFAKLMQNRQARLPRATAEAGVSKLAAVQREPRARDPRHDVVVRMLREREAEDREAREKRQRWYRQSLESDAGAGSGGPDPSFPLRLGRLRTKVPCRATPEARALLEQLRRRYPGATVTFPRLASGQQAVMLARHAGAVPEQIGRVEHRVESDPTRCNVRHQGLSVETDGGAVLVLRFRHPATPVRVSCARGARAEARDGDVLEPPSGAAGEVASVDFAELRPALDRRPCDRSAPPRLAWITRVESEMMNALGSRDYEAFYVRFKLEVLAGIWSSLSALLASAPDSQWHAGTCYTVLREPDAARFRIHQRTVDDRGRAVDIGANRVHDAAHATDILLLYLDGDILADVADIYFTLQSLDPADAYALKEELFTGIRRFWASSRSLASRYGGDLPAVVRMSRRALPTAPQAPLLQQDWTRLRQSLVDRYGEGGRRAAELVDRDVQRPRVGPVAWPFASFPAGDVDVGLRIVYRQEWRYVGAQRGDVVRTVPPGATPPSTPRPPRAPRGQSASMRGSETIVEPSETARRLDEIVADAARATASAMRWHQGMQGGIDIGARALAASTDMGLEAECRESSEDASARLDDVMRRMASRPRDETQIAAAAAPGEEPAPSRAAGAGSDDHGDGEGEGDGEGDGGDDGDAPTYVYHRLQHRYDVLTRPVEVQNVVLVAEKLPTPAEIDLAWVRRHAWILATVLLDESFRDALDSIDLEAWTPAASTPAAWPDGARDETTVGADEACGSAAAEERERPRRDLELAGRRERLYEHLRANVLHYQRAIWQREDPQQRAMRYRRAGKRVPLEWRFELAAASALTVEKLAERLAAPNVDGQFAAYSGGREADLDQVIDPAGPIGFHGNLAVYRMRPELGSEELFSMLHFFKSPYLRPDPETGAPVVDDPLQIRLAEDPAVIAASDRVMEGHRDEMLPYLPELGGELGRERARSAGRERDGVVAGGANASDRERSALRHQFATYLFRRERTRQVALDTDGLVIDVVRGDAPAHGRPERGARIDPDELPEGYRLVEESARGLAPLSASGHRDAGAAWAILPGGAARARALHAGIGAAPDDDRHSERGIVARGGKELALTAPGGAVAAAARGAEISAPADREGAVSVTAGVAGVAPGRRDPEAEPCIVARDEGALVAPLRAGVSAGVSASAGQPLDGDAAPAIAAGDGEEWTRGLLLAGARAAHDDPPVIRVGDDAEPKLTTLGGAVDERRERAILSRDDDPRVPRLLVGAAGTTMEARGAATAPVIVARAGGESLPELRAGITHDPQGQWAIVTPDDGRPELTAAVGDGADHAPEPVLMARGDGERTLSLHAGAGRAHERLLPARNDRWLRPNLIAG